MPKLKTFEKTIRVLQRELSKLEEKNANEILENIEIINKKYEPLKKNLITEINTIKMLHTK